MILKMKSVFKFILIFVYISAKAQFQVEYFKKEDLGIKTYKPDTILQIANYLDIHPDFVNYANNSTFLQTDNIVYFVDSDKSYKLYTYDTECTKELITPCKELTDTLSQFLANYKYYSTQKYVDKNRRVWILGYNLLLIDNGRKQIFKKKSPFPKRAYGKIIEDFEGNIWLCNKDYIALFDNGKWLVYKVNELGIPKLWKDFEFVGNKTGKGVWIIDDGVFHFDGSNKRLLRMKIDPSNPSLKVGFIGTDKDKTIWCNLMTQMGKNFIGSVSIDTLGTVTMFGSANGMPKKSAISSIYDIGGLKWFFTSKGIYRLDNNRFIKYSDKPTIAPDTIQVDSLGNQISISDFNLTYYNLKKDTMEVYYIQKLLEGYDYSLKFLELKYTKSINYTDLNSNLWILRYQNYLEEGILLKYFRTHVLAYVYFSNENKLHDLRKYIINKLDIQESMKEFLLNDAISQNKKDEILDLRFISIFEDCYSNIWIDTPQNIYKLSNND